MNEAASGGKLDSSTRLIRKAPPTPRADPTAAPSRRPRLTLRRRLSNKMIAVPLTAPTKTDGQVSRPNGFKWNDIRTKMLTNMIRVIHRSRMIRTPGRHSPRA